MNSTIMTVTPEQAAKWLKHNPNNRSPKKHTIECYATDMASGNWKLTHQGISFDDEGNLTDGQNRLMACVMANVPFKTMVTFGVEQSSAIDSTLTRSAIDRLKFDGKSFSCYQLALARYSFRMRNVLKPSDTQLSNWLEENREIQEMALRLSKMDKININCTSVVAYAFACAIASGESVERLNEFRIAANSGFVRNGISDYAAFKFARMCLDTKSRSILTSRNAEAFDTVANMIWTFCRGLKSSSKKHNYILI